MNFSTFSIFIFCFKLANLSASAQEKQSDFTLNGKINLETGKILLTLVADSNFYPKDMRHIKANIVNGEFSIKGTIPQPLAFQISTEEGGFMSELFVLDTGKQDMMIDAKLNKSIPKINNKIMLLDYPIYTKEFEQVSLNRKLLDSKWDSLNVFYKKKIPSAIQISLDKELKESYKENDSTLLAMVSKYPNSYYAFWRLLKLTPFGYEDIFSIINTKLSTIIKNSYTGRVFANYLSDFNLIALSDKIQKFPLEGMDGLKVDSINYAANNYTLLDFWYSNCSPCIAQFNDLKSIYTEYCSKGFEIIGISTDNLKWKEKWASTVDSHKLSWPQYLDLNGVETTKLRINAFPSNFLVDKKGQIVASNILPSELALFLKSREDLE